MTREEQLAAIKAADDAYYNQDDPVMTDPEYDRLRNDYINQYGSEDLNYVPGDTDNAFKHFMHTTPVTSLGKVKESEPEKLRAAIEKLWPVIIELKYDGLTVVAYPNSDGSCKYVTRGNGEVGDILPHFIHKYEGVSVNTTEYPVRGEVYMDTQTFNEINAEKEAAGEEPFRNKRNAAAGILRNKERSPYLDRLNYVVYDLPGCPDVLDETIKLNLMRELTKFDVAPAIRPSSIDDAIEKIHRLYKYSNKEIPVDGIVIKSDQSNSLAKFGRTGHHPNNAIAWKAETEKFTTTLLDVEWQVGRDRLTPVAIMRPIEIDGTMVSKASLHNWGNIQKLDLHKNDIVVVEKSNEIIPQIIENRGHIAPDDFSVDAKEAIKKPTKCPACWARLETRIAGTSKFGDKVEVLYCPNPKCDEKMAQQMAYMARKDVLNIEGLSIETARKICDEFYIVSPFEIFDLCLDDFEGLPGFASKSAQKLYDNIQNACDNVSFEKFIPACCILNVGHDIGKKLAAKFHTYGKLLEACDQRCDEMEFSSIEGIGPETAKILISGEFTDAMKALREYIDPLDYEPPKTKSVDIQYHIAITGKFSQPRSVYEKMITDAGHVIAKSVTGTTTHLMIADINSTSSKAKKARELGVELIDEKGLEELL